MRSEAVAKVLLKGYPSDVWIEDEDWKTMNTIRKAIEKKPSGDTLFDFVVKEIGQERSKKEIIRLLQRAVDDLELVIIGFKEAGLKDEMSI